jgi:hypothetical protein
MPAITTYAREETQAAIEPDRQYSPAADRLTFPDPGSRSDGMLGTIET